nr:serrate RNA effector molecule homolog [Chrysemys picta bellii]
MGDSDDEYDRRRRDKFRRERSDYDRSRERDERRRDDWSDREWDRGRERRSRGEYRDYDRNRRERFSPPRHELSPPQKRMRRDWDEHSTDPYHSGYEMPYSGATAGPTYGPPQPWAHPDMHVMQQHHLLPIQASRLGNIAEVDVGIAPPVMKSFKEFLLSLDDSVDETEAVKRYNDYKLDFRRQQMQDFFLAHKDEEWFRSKYHPDEAGKRKQEAHGALQNRLSVFLYLMDNGWFESLQLDIDKANAIVKMLDAAVIKMEGGTENDLKILDQEEEEERQDKAESGKKDEARLSDADRKGSDKEDKKEEGKKADGDEPVEEKAKKSSEEEEEKPEKEEEAEKEAKKASKKRKRKRSGDDSYDEGSVSESETESESGRAEDKEGERRRGLSPLGGAGSCLQRGLAGSGGWGMGQEPVPSRGCRLLPGPGEGSLGNRPPRPRGGRVSAPGEGSLGNRPPRPRGGRVSAQSASPPQLRECELSPGVNRDLTRRVRNINGITQHKQIVRNDIKLAAKLIHTLDDRTQLWGAGEPREAPQVSSLPSQNPILKNITDYLIEEVSAEEEELLGKTGEAADEPPKEGNPAEINVERDEKLIKVRGTGNGAGASRTPGFPLALGGQRGASGSSQGAGAQDSWVPSTVAEWQKTFEEKLAPLSTVRESLSDEEAQKMGKKDPEQEVEKFVTANTQELGKDKWLCPLSGKKFKGPEFVRKHIFNKHAEKIEEVKKEVSFFNSFLMDAKRPALPEIKPNQPPGPGQGLTPGLPYPHQTPQGLMPYGQPRPPIMGYGGGPPYPHAPYAAGRGNYDTFRGQGGYLNKPRNRMVRGDPRAIVEYRDLDAPEDVDFF